MSVPVDDATLVSVTMKKPAEPSRSVPWQYTFFVRPVSTGSSMVFTGYPEESVKSVLYRVAWITGIPVCELRMIYRGKQLQLEQTLEQCGIENDSHLHLVGHLRSGGYPAAGRIIDYMVSVLAHVCGGETVRYDLGIINVLTTRHFGLPGFAEVYASSRAPMMLVSLYLPPRGGGGKHRSAAEACISHFMSCCRAKAAQGASAGAVLEFCKQLRRFGCECDDALYVSCRNTLGFLLGTFGVSYGSGSVKQRVSLRDVFSFVPELAERLLMGLSNSIRCPSTSLRPSLGEVMDLGVFVNPLRSRIMVQQGLGSFVSDDGGCDVEEGDQLRAEEVDYLRVMFIRLLSKMDECFRVMAECLAGKEQGGWDVVLYKGWSEYLNVLKELYDTSKVFDDAEETFWRVLRHHRSMLSVLVVGFVKKGGDHRWILENKSVTNFECRRHLAMMLFPAVREDYDLFHEMLIDRSQLLAESFEYIGKAKPESLRSGLFMEFKNEEATGPGVLREWFVLVCRAIFNPQNALFLACPNDCRRFYPNPASKVHPLHLEYFRFSGRIIALALMRKVQVGIVFDRVFFMQLAGNYVTLEDIRDADPYLYRSCKQILEMDADFIDSDALGLTFVREMEVLGCRKVVELCPGGKSIVMNSKNREKYVDLLIQNCFVTSISEQVSHFAKGFADILSNSKLQQFFQCLELEDLDWMLHGSENTISIEDWKAHTKYKGYKETDRQISWFWEIVGRMSAKQRNALLFFWTSVKYLPVEGFRGLASHLYICRSVEPGNRLPSSHTCFFELCFPRYSSMAVMEDRLGVITQEHIGCSFGTG
ncbi:E3 ubiquitin-protein ligase UPL5 [Spatholobus suberectus]|nr:E3 ubiquitin-protein ligase UPL5 [Spatholobus suberectus]